MPNAAANALANAIRLGLIPSRFASRRSASFATNFKASWKDCKTTFGVTADAVDTAVEAMGYMERIGQTGYGMGVSRVRHGYITRHQKDDRGRGYSTWSSDRAGAFERRRSVIVVISIVSSRGVSR